jgi:hypothetical protein
MAEGKPTILVQLDADAQPSVFDAVVAVDAGVDHLFRHGGVTPEAVRELIYGAIFTRGPKDLHQTAVFVGGSDVAAGERIFEAVVGTFFGPFRVSVMFDTNGANTTAAGAVLAALEGSGGSLEGVRAAVLGGTGPVGQRVAWLLARLGATALLGSRSPERARAAAERLQKRTGCAFHAIAPSGSGELVQALADVEVVVAAGAPGTVLLPGSVRARLPELRAVIDLNAVPPLGVEGIEATDKGTPREGVRAWGALGVGGTKMKIHKRAVQELFTTNDKVLDAEEILAIGRALG